MKKISDGIVNHRYAVLILFIILAGLSVFSFSSVKINYDITKYLPSSSETRQGLDLMEKEFDSEISTLNILLEDLEEKEMVETLDYLSSLEHVEEVSVEKVENSYLFEMTLDVDADSKEATSVFQKVNQDLKDEIIETSGDVSNRNRTVLPFYVIVIAVLSAFIILEIMSESYIEPVLFLFVILIAVALNKGTNMIFPSVSHITESIASILQMALSMDYSIMLMNRYRQEREKEKDKVVAMKNALHHSFSSISSSSITTIVGLLALIFMSFTIGRDLGFVLAKGVLFSLLSIFACLPGLILLCDKWIFKWKKKSPIITLNWLGKLEYKAHRGIAIFFLIIFVGSYLLKGSLGLLYTESGVDKIDTIFTPDNQIVLIYPNEEEEKFGKYCRELDQQGSFGEVLCYGNTIDEALLKGDLPDRLNDLGSSTTIEDYIMNILYYHYYHPEEDNTMTLGEFVSFLQDTVYQNEDMAEDMTPERKKEIDKLAFFSTKEELAKKRTISEIATTLNIEKSKVEDLFTYYDSKKVTTKLTLKEFANFLNQKILTNSKYQSQIDSKTKESIQELTTFTDKNKITKKMSSQELATFFSLEDSLVESLYTYYGILSPMDKKMTIDKFVSFLVQEILPNPNYEIEEETASTLEKLATILPLSFQDQPMTPSALGEVFGIEEGRLRLIFMLLYAGQDFDTTLITPYEFVGTLVAAREQLEYWGASKEEMDTLENAYQYMTSVRLKQEYSYSEMSKFFSLEEDTTKSLYVLFFQKEIKLNPQEFVNFLLEHQNDDLLKGQLSKEMISKLNLLKKVMNSALKNQKYTSSEMSKFLSMDSKMISNLYSLYDQLVSKKKITISYQEFIPFLLNDVMKEKEYQSNFSKDTKERLTIVNQIITDTLHQKEYDKEELYQLLSSLSNNLEKDLLDLVYMYYGSEKEFDSTWTLTVEEFVTYLNTVILKDKRFEDYIDAEREKEIKQAEEDIADAKELLIGKNHSRIVLNTKLEKESKETFELLEEMREDLKGEDVYFVGDSPMALEMSKTFQGELNFITILTMLFIFLVVAVTFHSVFIAILLVLLIQSAVFFTMGVLSFTGSIYFISILIVQSILMGATIDYAILYTSYYLEARKTKSVLDSIVFAYNNSIHTIVTSASILVIVTLIVGVFASAVAGVICRTLSKGTFFSAMMILLFLPGTLATFDKWIVKEKRK